MNKYLLIICVLISNLSFAQLISQDFEYEGASSTNPDLGWIQNSETTPGYGWFYDTVDNFIINGSRSAVCYGDNDDWLISPAFTLSQDETIDISFNYRTNPDMEFTTETANITVYIGTVQNETMANDGAIILEDEEIAAPDAAAFSSTFTATTSGTYYLGFHVITDANESFSVDDVLIDTALSTNDFLIQDVYVIPNPASDKISVKGKSIQRLEKVVFIY